MPNSTSTNVLIESCWQYLSYLRRNKNVCGEDADLWCSKYEAKVDMPIASIMGFTLRFEMEDHDGTTIFVSLDSEVQKLVCQIIVELKTTSTGFYQ
ncbi:hypothetical protein MKW98_032176 [Papaver atlanticum]|uniref:Uncharacterized protein n=1 Tax=Papaver atlanticum TaxID=357466 RepID=A0AAD4SFW5_9MAGN|nr:hypothetical protein MKW98_032176 [Papaver atlanticum]